mgnify:CR=1 FL=1
MTEVTELSRPEGETPKLPDHDTILHRQQAFDNAAVYEMLVDDRFDYGETRYISAGDLHERMVIVVWTQRGEARHIISMRKANEREQGRYTQYLD